LGGLWKPDEGSFVAGVSSDEEQPSEKKMHVSQKTKSEEEKIEGFDGDSEYDWRGDDS